MFLFYLLYFIKEINYIINPLLGLKKLVIHEFNLHEETSYLKHLITPSMRTTLQHLDLRYQRCFNIIYN